MSTLDQPILTKYDRIASAVRDRIVRRELLPGSRLPPRSDFERKFDASSVTVQQAFGQLIQEGFVQVRPKRGTFVSDQPPHLTRYAVVFCQCPSEDGFWSRFFSTINQVSLSMRERYDLDVRTFYGVDRHDASDDFGKLVRQVRNHCFAGLIFATPPFRLVDTPVLTEPGLPRVGIMDDPMPGVAAIQLDQPKVVEAALDHLQQRGRRRIAILSSGQGAFTGRRLDHLNEHLARRAMETRPFWLQAIDPHQPEAVRNCTHLLMRCQERPDGLVILDDNLEEHAAAGLMAAGAAVPDALDVVAHCNFPAIGYPTIPLRRVGFDLREMLLAAVRLIDRQRAGETIPQSNPIAPKFDLEIEDPPRRPRG